MKALLLSLSFLTSVAHADYKCVANDKTSSLEIHENFPTRVGDSEVVMVIADQAKSFYTTAQSDEGGFLSKKVFDFYPHTGDSLTLVHHPVSCGRAGCFDNEGTMNVITTAQLSLSGNVSSFSCHEAQF